MQITAYGKSSNKILHCQTINGYEGSLMDYLISIGLPIASSCIGEGVCQKCNVWINKELKMSCQHLLNNCQYDLNIEIDYL